LQVHNPDFLVLLSFANAFSVRNVALAIVPKRNRFFKPSGLNCPEYLPQENTLHLAGCVRTDLLRLGNLMLFASTCPDGFLLSLSRSALRLFPEGFQVFIPGFPNSSFIPHLVQQK
jgi:hypothetical protein